jgi:hypothetical protein
MKRTILVTCLVLIAVMFFVSSLCHADISRSAVLFLRIAAGARAAGMGEAFVAVADDATATHWNPAGLGVYPLTSTWLEYPLPSGFELKSMAILRNDIPELNYKRYDVWVMNDSTLLTLHRGTWISLQDGMAAKGGGGQPEGKLTAIASDGQLLWVGTDNGLFSFNGKRWEKHSTEKGLPSNNITALLAISKRYLWVGTDQGTAKFDGATWTSVPLAGETTDVKVVDFANRGEREFWAATESRLYKYDGKSWLPHEQYSFKIGDSLEKVVREFLGDGSEKSITNAIQKVKAYNSLSDSAINTGQMLNIPFELGLNGKITALQLDDLGSLWVGTNRGLKRYTDSRWYTYGYRIYQVEEGEDASAVAQKFLRSKDEARIAKLSQIIIEYNQLDPDGKLETGEKVYVYYNATGSEILSLTEVGRGDLFVGTQYGTIRWDGESWSRYYHGGLEKEKTKEMIYQDGEMWFATGDKVVIYAHAKKEITFMHANWLPELADDLYYDYLSGVMHMEGWGTVGGNVTFLSLGENIRTDESGKETGRFDSFEMAFTFSYGTRLSPTLSTGLSAKVIYSKLSDQGQGHEQGKGSGSSFALDAGLLYDTPIKKLTLGAALTNLGPNIAYIDLNQSDPLPRNLAVGLAYKVVDSPFNRLTVTTEVNKELVGIDDSFREELREAILNTGAEYCYGTYVSLRGGYVYDKVGDVKNPTFGAGLQYDQFRFDFAYIPSSKTSALSNTMRFSMTGRF